MTTPTRILATLLALSLGGAIGAGMFTFHYGKGTSYLTNDPEACANCHVMGDYLTAWTRSSHRDVAVCNDCHAPHDVVGKLVTKAINGWNHSVAFTTGNYPLHLRITDFNRGVTEAACRDCHASFAEAVDGAHDEPRGCLTCHAAVGHAAGVPIGPRPRSGPPPAIALGGIDAPAPGAPPSLPQPPENHD